MPPSLHFVGDSKIEVIDMSLLAWEENLKLLKYHLKLAQERMVKQANKRRSEREFSIGDHVLLKQQPYRQGTLTSEPYQKSLPR